MKRAVKNLLLFCFIISSCSLYGQTNFNVDPDVTGVNTDKAAVRIDGKVLFYVSGISSFPADQRAAAITRRIKNVAENDSISADSLIIISEPDRMLIYAGKEFLLGVYNNDALAEGIDIKLLSEIVQSRIKSAIKSYRENRAGKAILKNIILAIGACILYVIIMIMFSFFTKWMSRIMTKRLKSSVDLLENKSYRLISSIQMWKFVDTFLKSVKWLLILLLTFTFIEYTLGLFPWTNSFAESAFSLIIKPLSDIGKGIVNYLPSLVFLIVIILLTRYLLKLIKTFFIGVGQGTIVLKGFYPEWSIPTFKIMRLGIILFAVILAFPYIPGSESPAFKGVSVFIGVLLSLGSSSFISNIIAGYTMTYRRAFKNGDLIKVDSNIGFVEEQKLLATRIRSYKNEEIIIPNSTLLNSIIINYKSMLGLDGLILHTTVGIGYETPWRQVDAMLKLAAFRTEGVLKDPPPFVLKNSLGDYAVNYELNAYVKDVEHILDHYNNLHQNILDVFNENNVQIMTPSYMNDPREPKVVPKDKWNMPLASEN